MGEKLETPMPFLFPLIFGIIYAEFGSTGGIDKLKTVMRPKTILTIIFLLLALFNSKSVHAQNLILWHSDGTKTEVELYTQPRIVFANNKVLVISPVINIEYDKNDIIRFTYKGKSSNINIHSSEKGYDQKDGQIIFHNIKSTEKIAIYKINGIRVPVHFTYQGKDAILSLTSIPSGVYLFSVNGLTSKFTKK